MTESLSLRLDPAHNLPLVSQLHDALARRIESGALRPGTRLPSVRTLARECEISTLTATNAYNRLVASGHVEARRASGYFVLARTRKRNAAPTAGPRAQDALLLLQRVYGDDSLTLQAGSGWLPETLVFADGIKHGLATLARRQPSAFTRYGHAYGYVPLRQQIQTRLAAREIEAAEQQIVLTHGASHALDLIARALLQTGDTVLVDDPGYCNLLPGLRALGVNIIGVPFTAEGPDPLALEQIARQHQPKAFFTNSNLQNPSGACCTPATAHRLLQLAEQHDFYIVEDDIFAELHPGTAHSIASLDQLRRVIHVGSFSKTISPALRVGFIACEAELAERLVSLKMAQGLTTSEINEQLVHVILSEGTLRGHLTRVRTRLAQAQQQVSEALLATGYQLAHRPVGGMFLWAGVPHGVEVNRLVEQASAEGILLAPGYLFRPDLRAEAALRINVAHADNAAFYRFLQRQ